MAGKKAAPDPGPRSPSGISYTHVVVVAVALFTVLCVVMMPYVPDDSYISFRYAENLADGKGLTFNPGEPPVEGYSNLLWILLCAVIYGLGMELPAATPVFGVIIGILIFLSLAALYRRRSLPAAQAAIPMLALAASGPFLIYTISGMETALFTLLLVGTLLVADRFVASADIRGAALLLVCGLLAALARPEGILVFPVAALLLARASERRRPLLITSGVFVLLLVVYNVWRVNYFGEWLPAPFMSKGGGGVGLVEGWARNALLYFVNEKTRFQPQGYYYLLLMVPGVHAAGALGRAIDKVFTNRGGAARVAVVVSALIISAGWVADLRLASIRLHNDNETTLVELGEWLGENVPPGSLLSTDAPGIMPYYSRLESAAIQPSHSREKAATNSHWMDFSNVRRTWSCFNREAFLARTWIPCSGCLLRHRGSRTSTGSLARFVSTGSRTAATGFMSMPG